VERLPIIYVRGFAGNTSGIDASTEDPFYGFNVGSSHVRVGANGEPLFYQFESPLIRLMLDHDYQLYVRGGQLAWLSQQPDASVELASIWIHRFYDVSASSWGDKPQEFSLENAASDLLDLIQLVQKKTGAPRVHLVAHSMGGLICRCLIQKIIPEHEAQRQLPGGADTIVDSLFTYATPHGGIEFAIGFGLLEKLRDEFGIAGADIFGPARMWQYLNSGEPGPVPDEWHPQEMPDSAFPKHRIFTLVGTNPEDYATAMGLASKAVGVKSDGLVQISNAYVPGARFAYVHRSHSGRYGIVNSEEGYQNLRRFLFGGLAVTADLVGLQLPDKSDHDVVWQAEVELAVRGLPILMHQQVAGHHCPIILEMPDEPSDRPHPLVTTFLLDNPNARPEGAEQSRYSLHLRILSLRQRRGFFDFQDHLEQTADFDDILIVDIGQQEQRQVAWAVWNSQVPGPVRDYEPTGHPLEDENPEPGVWIAQVPLPDVATAFLGAGAAVRLTIRTRNDSR
jgi:hypothetical protein